jgi:hypothetical protein
MAYIPVGDCNWNKDMPLSEVESGSGILSPDRWKVAETSLK